MNRGWVEAGGERVKKGYKEEEPVGADTVCVGGGGVAGTAAYAASGHRRVLVKMTYLAHATHPCTHSLCGSYPFPQHAGVTHPPPSPPPPPLTHSMPVPVSVRPRL